MLKDKDSALEDFRNMIKEAWTYKRMSIQEHAWLDMTFDDLKRPDGLHGSYEERWNQLLNIYSAFLNALGYLDNPMYWREKI